MWRSGLGAKVGASVRFVATPGLNPLTGKLLPITKFNHLLCHRQHKYEIILLLLIATYNLYR